MTAGQATRLQGDDLGLGANAAAADERIPSANLKDSCGVDISFDVVEWQILLHAARATPDSTNLKGAMAINVSSGFVSPQSWFIDLTLVSMQ